VVATFDVTVHSQKLTQRENVQDLVHSPLVDGDQQGSRLLGLPPLRSSVEGGWRLPRQTGLEVISIFLKVNSPRFVGELTPKVNSRLESETIILLVV